MSPCDTLTRNVENTPNRNSLSLSAKFSPGHRIDWHAHTFVQLAFASSGVLHVQTARSTWIVPSHRAVWIPSNVSHRIEMFGVVMLRTLYFAPNIGLSPSDECLAVNVSSLMRELIIHVCQKGIVSADSRENRSLVNFLISQARAMSAAPLVLPMPVDDRALSAANELLQNPGKPISDLALELGTSSRTLQRIFARETGVSLGRWRSQARLLSALRLLNDGRPVTQVALDVGFDSLSAFILAFRKFFGVTPGKFFSESRGQ